MKEQYCGRDEEVAAAASAGSCDASILAHARSCPICSEILLIAKLLAEDKKLAAHEMSSLPDAITVWRKAQTLAREKAFRWATLPIRAARMVTLAVGATVVPLLIRRSGRLWLDISDLGIGHVQSAHGVWPVGLGGSLLMLSITGAFVLIGLGSWYMLREE
jgi:hypothetical protein